MTITVIILTWKMYCYLSTYVLFINLTSCSYLRLCFLTFINKNPPLTLTHVPEPASLLVIDSRPLISVLSLTPFAPSPCATLLAFPTSPSAFHFRKSSIGTTSRAFSCVACRCTFGTSPSCGEDWVLENSRASFQRAAQRHHLQPAVRPMERRLLPREAVKSRKGSVRVAMGGIIFVG
jgi:hypothetical protein